MKCDNNNDLNLEVSERCCTGNTGCEFDGSLRKVKAEPIFVQKVYDAALFQQQALRTVVKQPLSPALGDDARIIKVLDIRCKKFFNPDNIKDPRNLVAKPDTTISGGEFVRDKHSKPIEAIGPDGFESQKLIFANTEECDDIGKGTPIFGTQNIRISGNVIVEIDVLFTDNCDKKCKATLVGNIPIALPEKPLMVTNFFELCIPSVFNSAFLPRFTEFCNISCEPRLATNNLARDLHVDPKTGAVAADLLISLCVTCEKKIVVPVQLCVLSTGFPQLQAEVAPICTTFPSLFPEQIDKGRKHRQSETQDVETEKED